AAGSPAAGPRGRHRLRAAPAARGEHHRRPHAEPAPHPLHDPGRVPLPRALADADGGRVGADRRAYRRAPSRRADQRRQITDLEREESRMQLDPRTMKPESTYKLLIGCVAPRPIAWV